MVADCVADELDGIRKGTEIVCAGVCLEPRPVRAVSVFAYCGDSLVAVVNSQPFAVLSVFTLIVCMIVGF